MAKSYWIWHPGAFELYHSLLLHNRRTSAHTTENGRKSAYYPPMWRVDGPSNTAELTKTAVLEEEETIEVLANTENASVSVDGKKYPVGSKITLSKGEHTVNLMGFKAESFPAFYIKGNVFKTDRTWLTYNDNNEPNRHAGQSELYTDPCDNVEIFKFKYERYCSIILSELLILPITHIAYVPRLDLIIRGWGS